ncbi:hypothetical protein PY75_13520, partial [Lacticaseibacillus rhamnosus]
MNADTTFAVVDLETTGTSVKDGDRMIQFGCALVRQWQDHSNNFTNDQPGSVSPADDPAVDRNQP